MRKNRSDRAGFKPQKIIIVVFLMLKKQQLKRTFIEGPEARFAKVPQSTGQESCLMFAVFGFKIVV